MGIRKLPRARKLWFCMYAAYQLTNRRLTAQGLFARYESSVHAALNIPEKLCCCHCFSHCCHGFEKILSFPVRNIVLPVPSWNLTMHCSIPKVKVNVSRDSTSSQFETIKMFPGRLTDLLRRWKRFPAHSPSPLLAEGRYKVTSGDRCKVALPVEL